jgi:hypothetical protein
MLFFSVDSDDQVSLNIRFAAFLRLPIPATPHARTLAGSFRQMKRLKTFEIRASGLLAVFILYYNFGLLKDAIS